VYIGTFDEIKKMYSPEPAITMSASSADRQGSVMHVKWMEVEYKPDI